jgi:hypothetical protein
MTKKAFFNRLQENQIFWRPIAASLTGAAKSGDYHDQSTRKLDNPPLYPHVTDKGA